MSSEPFGGFYANVWSPRNQDAAGEGWGLEPEMLLGELATGFHRGNPLSPGYPHGVGLSLWFTPP